MLTRRPLVPAALLALCLIAPGPALARDDDPAQRALITANGLLRKGLHDLAIPEYRRYLESSPAGESASVARYGLAVCLFKSGQPALAGAELQSIVGENFQFAPDALLLSAHCAMAQSDFPAAGAACSDLLRRYPDHASAESAAALQCEALFRADVAAAEVAKSADHFARRFPQSPQRPRVEFFAGAALVRDGADAEAVERFDWIVQHTPDHELAPRAGLSLARSLEALGQFARAEERYRRAAVSEDPTLAPDAFLGLARIDLAAGRPDDARRRVQSILSDFPDSPRAAHAALLAARIACDNGNADEGLSALKAATSNDPDLSDDIAFWTARCRLVAGEVGPAAGELSQAIREFSHSELLPQMRFDLAVCLSRQNQPTQALAAFQEFTRLYPDHPLAPDAMLAAASILQQQGALQECLALCARMVKEFPSHGALADAELLLAECYYQEGDFAEAAAACSHALAREPQGDLRSRLTYRKAMSLYRDGAWDQARPLLESVSARAGKDSANATALHALGSGHFDREQWTEAARRMTQYLAADSEGPLADDALLKLGLSNQRLGHEQEALESFDALIARYPQSVHHPQALFERAQSLLALDRQAEAGAAFQRVIDEAPDSRFAPPACRRLGALAERAGDFTLAAQWYQRAGESPAEGAVESAGDFDRGRALLAAANYQGAIEALSAAIDAEPADTRVPTARAQRAIALARVNRPDEALAEMESLLRRPSSSLDPSLARALLYEQAWILRTREDTSEAEAAYRAFLATPTNDALRAHALIELGALLSDAQRWSDAWEALEQGRRACKETGADADLLATASYRLGVCALRLDRAEQSIDLLAEAADSSLPAPQRASADLFCAEALMKLGRNAEAAERLSRALTTSDDPQIARAGLLRLGDAAAAISDWPASARAFERWLDQFPSDSLWFQARFGMGWALQNQRQFEPAIESYRQVTAKHDGPTAARAQFQIGECLYAQGLHEDAVREFVIVDALYAYPQWSAAALYEAGRCLQELNRPDDARRRFEEVAQRFPDTQWAGLAAGQLASLPRAASATQADVSTGVTQ